MRDMPRVVAVAPALPAHRYLQDEIAATIGPLVAAGGRAAPVLSRLHAATGVRTRHLALPLEEYGEVSGFTEANAIAVREGTALAERAARTALAAAGLAPDAVDVLVVTTVTAVAAPSLDALLVEPLGLRPDVRRIPSFGWGCAGGAAGLGSVHELLGGRPDGVALLIAVELCSLTLQHGDDRTANLVASGLFGDGAVAAVVVGDEHPAAARAVGTRPATVAARSLLVPGTADQLGWDVTSSGLGIVLSAGLPDLVRTHVEDGVRALLEPLDLKVRDVTRWVVHAGGPKILDAVEAALDLDRSALAPSRASLAAVGNLSSASVLHVLSDQLDGGPDDVGVVLAFGPGVGVEMVALRWGAAA